MRSNSQDFTKKFATILSLISNSTLILLKVIAGIYSGSISIISEVIHSSSDLLASIIAYVSVKISLQPADEDHSFGHGKYEDLSGLLEGGLIIIAAIYILYEAVIKILYPQNISLNVDFGIYVMLISTVVNIIISYYLFKVARKTDSIAIYADAEHLRTDVLSSFGVCIGLILIKITKIKLLDPIMALIVAVIITVAGIKICIRAKNNLVDMSLEESNIKHIKEIINEFIDGTKLYELKKLRTRKAGIKKNIEITIIADRYLTIFEAHEICDRIESHLENTFGNTDITIHLEPNKRKSLSSIDGKH